MRFSAWIAACCIGMGLGASADAPQEYWYVGTGAITAENGCLLNDGSYATWANGNILRLVGAVSYLPANLQAGVTLGQSGSVLYSGAAPLQVYGIKGQTGWRSFGGTGAMELGAGGYEQVGNAWDGYGIYLSGGVRLTASQTWTFRTGLAFSDKNGDGGGGICPVTAVPGTVLTLASSAQVFRSAYAGAKFYGAKNDFSGSSIVVRDQWLSLGDSAARINADSITLDGANARLVAETCRAPVIDGDFTRHVILRNGAVLKLYSGVYRLRTTSVNLCVDNTVLDLDKVTVAEGTSKFGEDYAYSVKDGGTLLVEVAEGAKAIFMTLPTTGRIKVTGAGVVSLPHGATDVDYDAGFTGAIAFTDQDLAFPDLSQFAAGIVIAGSSVVSVPAVADWPATFHVDIRDSARLILPRGSAVDPSRITGTGNCTANGIGLAAEPAGTITVGPGEVVAVAGDGLTAATTVELAGGVLEFPTSRTVASPLAVSAKSWIKTAMNRTALITGAVTGTALLVSSNALTTVNSYDATRYPCGRTVLAGGGSFSGEAQGLRNSGGALELRGGEWTFGAMTGFDIDTEGVLTEVTSGAKVTLTGSENPGDKYRNGMLTANAAAYPGTFLVRDGSELTVGAYRMVRLGNGSWRGAGFLIVDNATVRILGGGEFDNGGQANEHLQNTSADRCPMGVVKVRNGGVLVTDRVFGHTTATHTLDDASRFGEGFEEGVRLELDGGTYRLGPAFGLFGEEGGTPSAYDRAQRPNQLFSQLGIQNVGDNILLTYTSEITVKIGANGGTFDLSGARAGNHSFSNTVWGALIPLSAAQKGRPGFAGMEYNPNRGPRWKVDGPLGVKGRGDQELVLNGLDPSALSKVVADGAVVRVIDRTGVESVVLGQVTLGAAGAGVKVETEDGAARSLSVTALTVDGVYDAGNFNVGSTTVGDVVFNAGAAIAATPGAGKAPLKLPVTGTATLAADMRYSIPRGVAVVGTLFSADGGIVPADGAGVTWTPTDGARARSVFARGNDVGYSFIGSLLIVR